MNKYIDFTPAEQIHFLNNSRGHLRSLCFVLSVLVIALGVALGLSIKWSSAISAQSTVVRQADASKFNTFEVYNLVGTSTNGVTEVLPWGPDTAGTIKRLDAPILLQNGTPTLDDLCQSATDVGTYYSHENPQAYAKEFQTHCDAAKNAFQANNGPRCTSEIQQLAQLANTNVVGAYHLSGVFTWMTVGAACNDTKMVSTMVSNGSPNAPVVKDF